MTAHLKEIWTQTYQINSFLVNSQKRLGLYSALNLLQDVGWLHAEHLGLGAQATEEQNSYWVLTRQKLVMDHWPSWGENVDIRTWIRPLRGPFASRDFEILNQGKLIGKATSSWLLLDAEKRTPVLNPDFGSKIKFREDHSHGLEIDKIAAKNLVQDSTQFQVRNSDLDMNNHVNNTRYAQWILDSIPISQHSAYSLKTYSVNFLAETRSDQIVKIQHAEEVASESTDPRAYKRQAAHFQGLRESDSKIVFTARLGFEPARSE